MSVRPRALLFLVVVTIVLGLVVAEIHRAKSVQQPKPRRPASTQHPARKPIDVDVPHPPLNDSCTSGIDRGVSGYNPQTWLYSIISAILVGLSGIFPLLVIPIDATEVLKNGASSGLTLLLSFAVGGLLGDVFLHLLPEAWAHANNMNARMDIGLWVLAGLLTFMVIEKVFPDSEHDEEVEKTAQNGLALNESIGVQKNNSKNDKHVELNNGSCKTIAYSNGKSTTKNGHHVKSTVQRRQDIHDKSTSEVSVKLSNGVSKKNHVNSSTGKNNSIVVRAASNMVRTNPRCNGTHLDDASGSLRTTTTSNGSCSDVSDGRGHTGSLPAGTASRGRSNSQSIHVKTSGWLNLLANMIDNFTHGLAVAGSYSVSTKTGLLTTAAILLHEVPHEIGDFAILLRSGFDRWKAAKAQMLTATGGLLGVVVALCAESTQEAGNRTAWILPFTSGSFIYIALVSVLPDILNDNHVMNSVKQMMMLVLGVAVMVAVTCLE